MTSDSCRRYLFTRQNTYALLAGESPGVRATLDKECPLRLVHFWSAPVLRVLEKATQTRLDQRYQTVQEFWDDLSDAALPPTRLLQASAAAPRSRPSFDLSVEPEELTQPPPQPRFQSVSPPPDRGPATQLDDAQRRPKIVVPVATVAGKREQAQALATSAREKIEALPDQAKREKTAVARPGPSRHKRREVTPRRARPYVVAAILIALFSGMLLATHKYVTSRWNPFADLGLMSDVFVIGREGVTTTDVNLRSQASAVNAPIGMAETGSRVKILSTTENCVEVQGYNTAGQRPIRLHPTAAG